MTEKEIYARCLGLGMTDAGAAGCTANILAESAGRPNNVEDRSCLDDAVYTAGVDSGTYGNFVNDRYGYGLCQWTLPSRKQALLNYARGRSVSIGNGEMQLLYLRAEMQQSYSAVWQLLTTTSDPYEAGYTMCKRFEIPANTEATSKVRGNRAREIYNRCAGETPVDPDPGVEIFWPPRQVCKGMKGADVAALQALLIAHGYSVTVIDGIFGESTDKAVRKFQTDHSLAVDGIAGPNTWGAILKR